MPELPLCVLSTYFNPRSREGSDFAAFTTPSLMPISIHAPAKGATPVSSVIDQRICISIHAPAKGATFSNCMSGPAEIHFNPRSREGSDGFHQIVSISQKHFNPRSREGSDILRMDRRTQILHFNPRSREGSDRFFVRKRFDFRISIHAPAKGATSDALACNIL